MSAEQDSSTSVRTVYVRLLGEGTLVYRPTPATPVGEGAYELSARGVDVMDEEWEFEPGTRVRVEERELSGGRVLVAVELLSS